MGHGGIAAVARASGAARSRVQQGVAKLTGKGHPVASDTVARLLKDNGFSLQANAKTLGGRQHPDRDAQFGYLNNRATEHLDAGQPVISVDTKKKELIGQYKNNGTEWRPAGEPEQVKVQDFIDKELGKANPYGVYDVGTNTDWVSVGTDHDTAAFALNTIRSWWNTAGKPARPHARAPPADHRRRRRIQRLPHPALEDRARRPGPRDWPGHHLLSSAPGHQ